MPTLYIVATPIGNLEDITLRALRVLREVGLIAAEDTRVTRKLLTRHGISTRLTSFHEHTTQSKLDSLVATLEERDVALVSDAGMPGISDPGQALVRAAATAGLPVVPVPGPSALSTAIAVSGLPASQITYVGFLPRRQSQRKRMLQTVSSAPGVLVVFEAPHRLLGTLSAILETLGDRQIAACREMTKIHEEVFRGSISGAIAHFTNPKGEFTLVIAGSEGGQAPDSDEEALALASRLRAEGVRAQEAVAVVAAATGLSRRKAYRIWLDSGAPS